MQYRDDTVGFLSGVRIPAAYPPVCHTPTALSFIPGPYRGACTGMNAGINTGPKNWDVGAFAAATVHGSAQFRRQLMRFSVSFAVIDRLQNSRQGLLCAAVQLLMLRQYLGSTVGWCNASHASHKLDTPPPALTEPNRPRLDHYSLLSVSHRVAVYTLFLYLARVDHIQSQAAPA
jgi:hypothetical protein